MVPCLFFLEKILMKDKIFLLVGFIVPDDISSDESCFTVPVYEDYNANQFILNAKLEKLQLSAGVDAWELQSPVGLPCIERRDDLLYGFLFRKHLFIGPHRLLSLELREVRKKIPFHSMYEVVIDRFVNDMEKAMYADPKLPLMKFLIE